MHQNDVPLVDSPSAPPVRKIFLAWEMLRIAYNGILIPLVLFVLLNAPRHWTIECPAPWAGSEPGQIDWVRALVMCAIYGAIANVFYLLGPMVEAYTSWLGWSSAPRRLAVRVLLFVLGTLFTAVTAVAFVSSMLTNGFA